MTIKTKMSRVPRSRAYVKHGKSYKELLKEALKKEPVNYSDYKDLTKK